MEQKDMISCSDNAVEFKKPLWIPHKRIYFDNINDFQDAVYKDKTDIEIEEISSANQLVSYYDNPKSGYQFTEDFIYNFCHLIQRHDGLFKFIRSINGDFIEGRSDAVDYLRDLWSILVDYNFDRILKEKKIIKNKNENTICGIVDKDERVFLNSDFLKTIFPLLAKFGSNYRFYDASLTGNTLSLNYFINDKYATIRLNRGQQHHVYLGFNFIHTIGRQQNTRFSVIIILGSAGSMSRYHFVVRPKFGVSFDEISAGISQALNKLNYYTSNKIKINLIARKLEEADRKLFTFLPDLLHDSVDDNDSVLEEEDSSEDNDQSGSDKKSAKLWFKNVGDFNLECLIRHLRSSGVTGDVLKQVFYETYFPTKTYSSGFYQGFKSNRHKELSSADKNQRSWLDVCNSLSFVGQRMNIFKQDQLERISWKIICLQNQNIRNDYSLNSSAARNSSVSGAPSYGNQRNYYSQRNPQSKGGGRYGSSF
jgi:hypothetical protein